MTHNHTLNNLSNFHYLDKFMSHLPGSFHTLLEVLDCFRSISIFPKLNSFLYVGISEAEK